MPRTLAPLPQPIPQFSFFDWTTNDSSPVTPLSPVQQWLSYQLTGALEAKRSMNGRH